MTWYIIVALSAIIIFLFFLLSANNRNGKVEIRIIKTRSEKMNMIYGNFIFEITYISKKLTSKEQSAAIIDYLVRDKFNSAHIDINDSVDLAGILESISKTIERETGCKIVGKKTRILITQLANWPKEIFSKI